MSIMMPEHERWEEFTKLLEGPEGCDFQKDEHDDITWVCGGDRDQSKSKAILTSMGFTPVQVEASLNYFTDHGGHCDCEVLFNVSD